MRHLVHFLLTFSTYTVLINGQGVLPAESSLSLDPLVTLVGCLREEKPGYCLQRRALNFFESWLTTQGDDEDIGDELNQSDDTSERLPAGLSPYWSKLVDSVAERLSKMYGEEEDEPEEVEDILLKDSNKVNKDTKIKSRQGDSQIEARDKKYKKDKKVKVAMTVILLIIYFIKSTLFYMFDKVARTAIFAKLVFAFKIFVIVKLLELKRYLWWVKEEKKEQWLHGTSLHEHIYEEEPPEHYHYDSHSPPWSGGGGWPWYRSDHNTHQLAYSKQKPNPAPPPQHY